MSSGTPGIMKWRRYYRMNFACANTYETKHPQAEQLAADAEIPYTTVNELEAGKTNPTIASLMAMSEALEISLSELLDF
jgi:transcriptional regulator with XRE-family HTH domain